MYARRFHVLMLEHSKLDYGAQPYFTLAHTWRISQNLRLGLPWRTPIYGHTGRIPQNLQQRCHWEPNQKSTRRIPDAYPKIFSRDFPCAPPPLRTLGGINRNPTFQAIPRYICLANGCIVVRSFRVVVESPAGDESGAYPAHIPKSSAGAFLAHTLLWRFGAANADPAFLAIS